MSWFFEALQRSEAERSENTPPAAPQRVLHLLEAGAKNGGFPVSGRPVCCSPTEEDRLVCLTAPGSLAAEKFRLLAVRLRRLRKERQLRRVLVTSSIPQEGKSLVAANLALSLARDRQHRVLLVDGDLRRPSLARKLGLAPNSSLSDALTSDVPISDILLRLEPSGMCFLPASPLGENHVELLQSQRLLELMQQLSASFDWIVIDAPPLLPLADTSLWARLADGILLTVRPGTTEKTQFKKALEMIEPASLLGVVLNDQRSRDEKHYRMYYDPDSDSSSEQHNERTARKP